MTCSGHGHDRVSLLDKVSGDIFSTICGCSFLHPGAPMLREAGDDVDM